MYGNILEFKSGKLYVIIESVGLCLLLILTIESISVLLVFLYTLAPIYSFDKSLN
jgi:hypothetical protein